MGGVTCQLFSKLRNSKIDFLRPAHLCSNTELEFNEVAN